MVKTKRPESYNAKVSTIYSIFISYYGRLILKCIFQYYDSHLFLKYGQFIIQASYKFHGKLVL